MTLGELLGRGLDAEVYGWGEDQVAKLFFGQGRMAAAEKERRLAELAYRNGVPTPAVGEVVEIEGRAGIIFERLRGVALTQAMLADPGAAPALLASFVQVQILIHRVAAPNLTSRVESLAAGVRQAPDLDQALQQAVLGHLATLPDGDRLLHGDYHPDNLLVTPEGLRVIDWMNARRGTPAADVARTYVMLASPSLPPGMATDQAAYISRLRAELARAYLTGYCQQAGLLIEEALGWLPPVIAARLNERLRRDDLAWLRERLDCWGKGAAALQGPL